MQWMDVYQERDSQDQEAVYRSCYYLILLQWYVPPCGLSKSIHSTLASTFKLYATVGLINTSSRTEIVIC